MRAAGCYQVDGVIYTGKRYDRAAKFHTDTKSITRNIPLNHVDNLLDSALDKVPEGARIVCVELVEGATPLPQYQHAASAVYIFGPEDGSVSQEDIDRADDVVYVPTIGCLNLAATVNVLLYDRMAKLGNCGGGDALVRQSRDRNNQLKVRQ